MQKLEFKFQYKNRSIPYDVWTTSSSAASTVLFLGTVQVGRITEWVARLCPPRTIVVQGAPHWLANPDGSDTTDFVYRFGADAISKLASRFSEKGITVIADSQSAPFILKAALKKEYAALIRRIILIQPLGMNMATYLSYQPSSVALFQKRVSLNSLHQLPYFLTNKSLRYNYMQIYKLVAHNKQQVNAQYAAGLSHSALDDLMVARKRGIDVRIVCGEKDALFPPKEIQKALQTCGLGDIPILVVPKVPHSPLPTRQGTKLLKAALEQKR